MPGILYRGALIYRQLQDSIRIATKRGDTINFEISDIHCQQDLPIHLWLEPPRHGNPHTLVTVAKDPDTHLLTVYYPNGRHKYFD